MSLLVTCWVSPSIFTEKSSSIFSPFCRNWLDMAAVCGVFLLRHCEETTSYEEVVLKFVVLLDCNCCELLRSAGLVLRTAVWRLWRDQEFRNDVGSGIQE